MKIAFNDDDFYFSFVSSSFIRYVPLPPSLNIITGETLNEELEQVSMKETCQLARDQPGMTQKWEWGRGRQKGSNTLLNS